MLKFAPLLYCFIFIPLLTSLLCMFLVYIIVEHCVLELNLCNKLLNIKAWTTSLVGGATIITSYKWGCLLTSQVFILSMSAQPKAYQGLCNKHLITKKATSQYCLKEVAKGAFSSVSREYVKEINSRAVPAFQKFGKTVPNWRNYKISLSASSIPLSAEWIRKNFL